MSGRTSRDLEDVGGEEHSTDGDSTGTRYYENPGRDHKVLEEAGWELVEEALQITFWRNPESGRLYPQSAAARLVGEGQAPENADGT